MRHTLSGLIPASKVIGAAISFLFLAHHSACGCACCAEPNWYRELRGLMPYEMSELARLRPVGEWSTFVDRRDPPFALPQSLLHLSVASSGWLLLDSAWKTQAEVPDTLTPAGTFSWLLLVSDGSKPVDSLLFRYDSASQYQIDMRYVLTPSAYSELFGDEAETVLYKEVRLYGKLEQQNGFLSSMGFELSGDAVIRFHGHGNLCFGAADFDDWSLSFSARHEGQTHAARAFGQVLIE